MATITQSAVLQRSLKVQLKLNSSLRSTAELIKLQTGKMEKYFVAQLDELDQRRSRSKLVEVTFSRRPSTFGVLYVTRQRSSSSSRDSWLKLATLSLTLDNKAKFMIVREIKLSNQEDDKSSQSRNQAWKFSQIVDFDTMPSGQLLTEGANSTQTSAKQLLHSSVFLLSGDGKLQVASMIESSLSLLTTGTPIDQDEEVAKSQRHETFVQIKTAEHCTDENSTQVQVDLFLLSLSSFYLYTLTIRNSSAMRPKANPDLRLVNKYSLANQADEADHLAAKFVRMLPLAPSPNGPVVLIELSDGSARLVQESRCLAHLPGLCQNVAQSLLLLAPTNASSQREPDFLISVTNSNQCVANSLIFRHDLVRFKSSNSIRKANEREDDGQEAGIFESAELRGLTRDEADPDGLLVEEPAFELEHCWTINLNEFQGVQTMFDNEDDDGEDDDAEGRPLGQGEKARTRRRIGPGLCLPVWSPSGGGGLDQRSGGRPNAWPRFLLVFCQRHLLMFSFEQTNVLPFSIVYDRAFQNLTNSMSSFDEDSSSGRQHTRQQTAELDKRIDLKIRPKLLHNVKLIGTRISDNLFNMLLLSPRFRLVEASNFSQLALLAAVSNQGHVLTFKLTSKKLLGPNHKDNLYQQLLADSLRDSALLQDELNCLRQTENNIKMQIDKLEVPVRPNASEPGETKSINLHRKLQPDSLNFAIELEPNQTDPSGNLYDLIISWQSVVLTVEKVIVVSLVERSQLKAVSDDSSDASSESVKIKKISIENEEQNKIQDVIQGETPNITMDIRKCATIELDYDDDDQLTSDDQDVCLEFPESITRRNRLVVSMSIDEFTMGTVKVYFVCSANFKDHKYRHHQLPPERSQSMIKYNFGRQYIKRELPIKLLNSFRFVQLDGRATSSPSDQAGKVSFSGAFGLERALAWLGKLVDVPNDAIKMRGKEGVLLEFSSTSRQRQIRMNISGDKITFNGNAPRALDVIKQHILKEATDSSIKLELQTS